MRKTLLAGASLAVLLASSNVMAEDFTGTQNFEEQHNVSGDASFTDSNITVKYNDNDQATNARLGLIGSSDSENPSTLAFSGDNTITNKVTLEGNYKAVADKNASLTVDGYLTITEDGGKKDLSAVDLTIKNEANSTTEGELVTAGSGLTIGNTTMDKGTSIYTFGGDADINLAAEKKLTFVEDNKIYGAGGLNVKGAKDSSVDIKNKVDVDVDTSFDGADVNISDNGKVILADGKTLSFDNANVNINGAPNGVSNGIGEAFQGTVNFGEGTKNVNITEGAGIIAEEVNLNGGTYNVSGYMENANSENPKWQSGSIIQGGTISVGEKAVVNLKDGGQLVNAFDSSENLAMNIDGTVNLDNGMIRASSKQDGSKYSTLNVGGVINVIKDSAGIIASRLTNVLADGVVNVAKGGTLNLFQDMNRGAEADIEPTGENAKFNIAGALINGGTINAEKTDITVKGDTVDNQPEGGKYVSDNGVLNGNLTLSGEDNSAKEAAEQIAAAPKADFYGANTINGEVTNTRGLITINNGASLTVQNGENNEDKLTNNGIIDLAGSLNANVDGAGQISVKSSAAHVTSFNGQNVEIGASTSSSSLVDEASTAAQIYVSDGAEFNIDNDKIATNDLVTYGTTKLGTDYSSTKTKVAGNGTLDLGSHALTGAVNMWDNATLAFNVDQTKHDEVDQVGGKVIGAIATHLNPDDSATIKPVIGLAVETGTYQYADSIANAEGDLNLKLNNGNMLYDVAFQDGNEHILDINKKGSGAVASEVISAGGNATNANTLNAWVGGNSDAASLSGASQAMAEHLNTLAQTNPQELINATTALAPETAAMVQSATTENANQVFGAVGTRLSGGSISTGGEGMSSGDGFFHKGATWVQGLFNKSKLDDTRKTKGFDADSQGIAFGAEKYINDDVKLGVGYAYTSTDIDGFMRETDADTHTAIAYGEYRPSNWYVNAIATYGWSDYKEKKNVAGMRVNADYDVNSIGFQTMTGYDMKFCNGTVFTPEAGLRYVNIKQDSYRDSVGQRVSENNSDILTGVIGAKLKKDFALANGMNLRPEARFALTYDMVNDPSSSVVTLANGSAYTTNGEALDRFGMEVGAGLTTDVNDDVELSLGYEGKFRDHYEDHTGLINAKYKF